MASLFEAFDSLCEGTVVVDRDARVVWINERYAARFGVTDPQVGDRQGRSRRSFHLDDARSGADRPPLLP